MNAERRNALAFTAAQIAYDNSEPEYLPDEDEQEEQDDPEYWWP